MKNEQVDAMSLPTIESQSQPSGQQKQTQKINKSGWNSRDEEILLNLVERYGKKWQFIASHFEGKSSYQCFYHYWKNFDPRLSQWTVEQDKELIIFVKEKGSDWVECSNKIGKKPKDCCERFAQLRERYRASKLGWKEEEEFKLLALISKFGKSWDKISPFFPNKAKNTLCKRFYKLEKAYLKSKGLIKENINSAIFQMKNVSGMVEESKAKLLSNQDGKNKLDAVLSELKHIYTGNNIGEESFMIETKKDEISQKNVEILQKKKELLKEMIKKKIRERLIHKLQSEITILPVEVKLKINEEGGNSVLQRLQTIKKVLQNVNVAIGN